MISQNETPNDPINDGVFSETFHKEGITRFSNINDPTVKRIISYRTCKWKYIIDEEYMVEQLYDLENDPKEKNNLIKEYPNIVKTFRLFVIAHIKDSESKDKNLKDIIEKKKILGAIKNIKNNIYN